MANLAPHIRGKSDRGGAILPLYVGQDWYPVHIHTNIPMLHIT